MSKCLKYFHKFLPSMQKKKKKKKSHLLLLPYENLAFQLDLSFSRSLKTQMNTGAMK